MHGITLTHKPKHQSIENLKKQRIGAMIMIILSCAGFVFLFQGIERTEQKRNDWKKLSARGQTQMAPLIDLEKDSCRLWSLTTCYHATYVYQGITHQERISQGKYNALLNASSVEIIAVDNISYIAENRPDFRLQGVLDALWAMFLFLMLLKFSQVFLKTNRQLTAAHH